MDQEALTELLTHQDGLVARSQFVAAVGAPFDLQRLVRRRELVRLLPGVYLNHTGEPTWQQRAVAGVMLAGGVDEELHLTGAALGAHSALRALIGTQWRHGGGEGAPITVCIDDRRSLRPARGYRFVRRARLAEEVDWVVTPPRVRPAQAVIDVVGGLAGPLDAVGVLADACQSRCISATEIIAALTDRARVADRQLLEAILSDLAAGTASVLEHEFLQRVVRAHALPMPSRQTVREVAALHGARREYRDHEWLDLDVVVELDGRAFHDNKAQRDRDLDRDLDDAVAGKLSIRLGWGQATDGACATARKLAAILTAHGWAGWLRPCPSCPGA